MSVFAAISIKGKCQVQEMLRKQRSLLMQLIAVVWNAFKHYCQLHQLWGWKTTIWRKFMFVPGDIYIAKCMVKVEGTLKLQLISFVDPLHHGFSRLFEFYFIWTVGENTGCIKKKWTVCISPIIPKIQARSCRPISQMKMHIYSNILPKCVRSATIYCRVLAM